MKTTIKGFLFSAILLLLSLQAGAAAMDEKILIPQTGYETGIGEKSPMNIHHRPSGSDGIVEPVPGFLAGALSNLSEENKK
jgi:hypothetical protein